MLVGFLLLGLGGMAVSLLTDNVLLAALAGVFAFSSLGRSRN